MDYPEEWIEAAGALERSYRFKDFAEAMVFVNRLAAAAEEANHHPDLAISWNKVTVQWRTHSKGAITERDADMAQLTDRLVG